MKQYFFLVQSPFRKICFQGCGIAHIPDTNKKMNIVPHNTRIILIKKALQISISFCNMYFYYPTKAFKDIMTNFHYFNVFSSCILSWKISHFGLHFIFFSPCFYFPLLIYFLAILHSPWYI